MKVYYLVIVMSNDEMVEISDIFQKKSSAKKKKKQFEKFYIDYDVSVVARKLAD